MQVQYSCVSSSLLLFIIGFALLVTPQHGHWQHEKQRTAIETTNGCFTFSPHDFSFWPSPNLHFCTCNSWHMLTALISMNNKEWKHWNFHGQLCLLRFRREGFKQANRHPPTDLGQWLHCCQEKINSLNWNYPSVSQLQLNASPLVWLANNDIVESRLSIFPIIHLHVVLWWQVKHTSWLQRARSLFAHLTTQVCLHMLSSPVSGIMQQPFRKWQSNAFDWSLGSLMAQSMAMHTKSKYSTLTPPSFAMKSLKMFNGIVAH